MCKLVTGFRTKKVSTFFRTIQIAILQNIAQKCPYTDGAAVYYARVLLMPYDSTEYFDECEIVSFGGERMGFFEDVNENQNNGFINTEKEIELSNYPFYGR